jgi:hypothetical protein
MVRILIVHYLNVHLVCDEPQLLQVLDCIVILHIPVQHLPSKSLKITY